MHSAVFTELDANFASEIQCPANLTIGSQPVGKRSSELISMPLFSYLADRGATIS